MTVARRLPAAAGRRDRRLFRPRDRRPRRAARDLRRAGRCRRCSAIVALPRRSSPRTAPQVVPIATWIDAGGVEVAWALRLDTLSAVMIVVVTIVSAMVHVYSIGYMAHDHGIPRFMAYLSLFTFFMLMLVTANNFVQMFFGWEGVGLCSYLLVGFWYDRATGRRGGDQGLCRQPDRRFRLRARHLRGLRDLRLARFRHRVRQGAGGGRTRRSISSAGRCRR